MSSQELEDAYKRIDCALRYDSGNKYPEAYAAYLKTTTFITTLLADKPLSKDPNTKKLLNLSMKCIEACVRIQKSLVEFRNSDSEDDLLDVLDSLPAVPTGKPKKFFKKASTLPNLHGPEAKTPSLKLLRNVLEASKSEDAPPTFLEYPADSSLQHSPGQVDSHKLSFDEKANIDKAIENNLTFFSSDPGNDLSANSSSQRSSTLPTEAAAGTHSASSSCATLTYIPGSNAQSLYKVSPSDKAREDNAKLAAQYQRRKQRGMKGDTLAMIRAQEVNLYIAKQQEVRISEMAALRKERLLAEQKDGHDRPRDNSSSFDCICTSNIQYYRDLKQRLLKYNGDNDWVDQLLTSSGINDQEKLCRFLTRCLQDKDHYLYKVIGDAQFIIYNRLVILKRKVYQDKGIGEEIKSQLIDISVECVKYLDNLCHILLNIFPRFNSDEGLDSLSSKLQEVFYQPIWSLFCELNVETEKNNLKILEQINEKIEEYSIETFGIKEEYQIGENGFQNAKTVLDRLLEASSPNEKLEIVINFKKEIHSCIINYHVKKGVAEEEAIKMTSLLGADDLWPIVSFILTRSSLTSIYPEVLTLLNLIPQKDINGHADYCLATIYTNILDLLRRENEGVSST